MEHEFIYYYYYYDISYKIILNYYKLDMQIKYLVIKISA